MSQPADPPDDDALPPTPSAYSRSRDPVDLLVKIKAEGMRLDHYLHMYFQDFSRSELQEAIKGGHVTVNGRQIRLSGAFDDKGVAGGVGAVAVSAIVFAPAGFFMTGTSAKVAAGSIIKSFVDEDVPLSMPAAAEAPMAVGASAH